MVDVAGVKVGHAERVGDGWRTGVTVVLPPPEGAVCGVDVRGAAPGTRETDLLDPRNLVRRVHAVVLAGGSAYGLAAATGVMERLASDGVGFPVKPGLVVPIVPGAVIFDLGRGGADRATPDATMGAAAYDACRDGAVAQGGVGAGSGAVVGGLAGGVGSASVVLGPSGATRESPEQRRAAPEGLTVAALAVVNAAGSPFDPADGSLYAARLGLPGEFPARAPDPAEVSAWGGGAGGGVPDVSFNTVIGVVATDARLTKAQCARLASAAHDGLARAVRPSHTMTDGDTIFALATGAGAPHRAGADALDVAGSAPDLAGFNALRGAAADTFTRAIGHAVLAASGWPGVASYARTFPSALAGG
ncbi:MAG: peptidase S58 family protein [Micromonosporaceae bacterium]|nr:peptidase S58 family protein [Micromonosporaceae bacterium]